jgi:thymidylate synthase ThyX
MRLNKPKQAEVFAINGATPEVMAYAMAKYSRSSLSMRQSLKEIGSQQAEAFLNTFYFQYGHKSIADLAHISMAVENVSLLAAVEVVDEQRWDGQERSTRYQDFSKRLYYTPDDLNDEEAAHYHAAIHALFNAYDAGFRCAYLCFKELHPRPEGMAEDAYERTLRARSFDVARSLLPMATLTSVGQIVNARTLEGQINRMLTSSYPEVRDVAERLKLGATTEPAYDVREGLLAEAMRLTQALPASPEVGQLQEAIQALVPKVYSAPTLVKHTGKNTFQVELAKYVRTVLLQLKISPPGVPSPLVDVFICENGPSDVEIMTTLLYEHSDLPFRVIWSAVRFLSGTFRAGFMKDVLSLRGKHDELPLAFRASGGVVFDITMDIGGMRDMHRHRRTTQIAQGYSADSFSAPERPHPDFDLIYFPAVAKAKADYERMGNMRSDRGAETSPKTYLLPLGAERRFLMKMDVGEIAYISELRTGPAGHISYRRVAWDMFKALQRISPDLAKGIATRVTDPDSPLDFFKR